MNYKKISHEVARRYALEQLDEETWGGGTTYLMDVRDDHFVHFTYQYRADLILEDGVILLDPPESMGAGARGVQAVSGVWGSFVPNVQSNRLLKEGADDVVAILFETNLSPDFGYPEEVMWKQDVPIRNARIVPYSKGAGILKQAPNQIGEQDFVKYK